MKLIIKFNHLSKVGFVLLALLISTSCNDFLDINTDPDAAIADQANPDLLFAPAVAKVSANRMADAGWFVGLWAQQVNQNGSSGLFRLIENYNQFQVIVQNLWNVGYEDGAKNLEFAARSAENAVPVRPNAAGQAKLFLAWNYFYITTFFGDIPLSEALNAIEFPTPAPDTQEEVFLGIISLIDEALAQIDVNNPAPPITSGDLIYGGNMTKWIKFGNSLKLKTYMFLAGKDSKYQSNVADLINSGVDFMDSASDNAESPFFTTPNNENNLFKFAVTIAGDGTPQSDTWYAGDVLVDLMKPSNDPRLRIYFQPSRTSTTDEILANTSASLGFDQEVSEMSLNILRADFPDRMLTASETQLFIAEAYTRGYVGGSPDLGKAEEAFRKAINANLDFWNANIPFDPSVVVTDDMRDAFINQGDFKLSGLSAEQALEQIYKEHYISLFVRGSEVWTQVRRVGYPELSAPPQALFGQIPQRYLYPNEEVNSNPNFNNSALRTDALWFKE